MGKWRGRWESGEEQGGAQKKPSSSLGNNEVKQLLHDDLVAGDDLAIGQGEVLAGRVHDNPASLLNNHGPGADIPGVDAVLVVNIQPATGHGAEIKGSGPIEPHSYQERERNTSEPGWVGRGS